MRLTTRGRYAVTAMLDLALNRAGGPVALADIAKRHDISLSYLEQLFAQLRKGELVRSVRGPGGGYYLNKDPETISVATVIALSDEKVDATRCGGKQNCHNGRHCLTHDLWSELNQVIQNYLMSVSLADLVKRMPQEISMNYQVMRRHNDIGESSRA